MQFDLLCIECLVKRRAEIARTYLNPEAAFRYMKDVLRIMADAPTGVAAPYMIPLFADALTRYGLPRDLYQKEKRESNEYALSLLPELRPMIAGADDPLLMALQYSCCGNYIDFGIFDEKHIRGGINDMIKNAANTEIDVSEYHAFLSDLQAANSLLIIGDNAGEIALDTLLVEQLQARFPVLKIRYGVRGGCAQNDALREDAVSVGMDRLVEIVDSGSNVAGTELSCISAAFRAILFESDVVLAKGQGNFETMAGCGLPVYYLFLAKCHRVCRMLGLPLMTSVFAYDRRLPKMETYLL